MPLSTEYINYLVDSISRKLVITSNQVMILRDLPDSDVRWQILVEDLEEAFGPHCERWEDGAFSLWSAFLSRDEILFLRGDDSEFDGPL